MKRLLLKIVLTALTGATILIPSLRGFYLLHNSGERATDHGHQFLMALSGDLDRFAADHGGRFPKDLNALPLAHEDRSGIGVENIWGGVLRAPLLEMLTAARNVRSGRLLDPWGRPWQYRSDVSGETVRVESLGADGKAGGSGEDADLILTKREDETALSTLGHEPLW
ncbi:type II secretion system protein GspG [Engelhardtia mirabilis]|uniref:Bacterial type II secretion system protein G n=1 Tax=Engelhardtia mirabilis TaxID=2528011 RepID=A0A518BF18_9BACT|nr:Bacterial type II secretion system protein G [Planctomycetes bacterium Pla133]QDU99900.1 Bacterial type II secretion system protein G [Planctomycetes bacterium Pla86]